MKATLLFFVLNAIHFVLFSQEKTTIYCFPGQGANRHLFDSLRLDTNYTLKIIEYGTPERGMDIKSFAKSLAVQIDTTQKFVLLGVSLGGMICVELNELLHPEKTILISSAKNRNELPFRYKFQKVIPFYKLFGGKILIVGAKCLQPIVEPDRNKNKATFKAMLGSKSPIYMKRSIALIINWERTTNTKQIYHIHGAKDHTLPIKHIVKPYAIVSKGSHMMTLTSAKEISKIVNTILLEK